MDGVQSRGSANCDTTVVEGVVVKPESGNAIETRMVSTSVSLFLWSTIMRFKDL